MGRTPVSGSVSLGIRSHNQEWVLEGGGDTRPLPLSAATRSSVVTSVRGMVPARSTGTHTPLVAAPPPSSDASYTFCERDEIEKEWERERERGYVCGEYGMGGMIGTDVDDGVCCCCVRRWVLVQG